MDALEARLRNEVEDFVINHLKREILLRFDEVVEDTLVEAMKGVVIRLYRNDNLEGINFNIHIDWRDKE